MYLGAPFHPRTCILDLTTTAGFVGHWLKCELLPFEVRVRVSLRHMRHESDGIGMGPLDRCCCHGTVQLAQITTCDCDAIAHILNASPSPPLGFSNAGGTVGSELSTQSTE